MKTELTEDNFLLFAARNYDNPQSSGTAEFLDDLQRFKYLKRLLKKYEHGKVLRDRLIINHLIVIYNLFGIEAATKMVFFKVDERHWPQLKTFLVFLNFMPDESDIPLDNNIVSVLRNNFG